MDDLKFAFRRLLKRPGFAPVAVLLLGLRAAAADTTDASAPLPLPQAIVARHIEAIGGHAALLKHQSYHLTGGVRVAGAESERLARNFWQGAAQVLAQGRDSGCGKISPGNRWP